ncbi:hypothetical protein KPL78_06135 [Roseomonas sp. HJA6]|uniref:Uncharacterized protein n=1 Tax=Roseomonas alba TaxID=2846776 RepID=A0ABS7A529_9PROT|nr:hypothetical protein [Neoroseomonas alba]MBW6397421.1 hypothetical protein [Neoroseomonas alba]
MECRFRLLPIFALLLNACNGQIYHGSASSVAVMALCRGSSQQGDLSADHGGVRCGVPFLPLHTVVQHGKLTTQTDPQGNIIGSETGLTLDNRPVGRCSPVPFSQIVTIADSDNPQIIWYQPGFLESVQFSVGLNANGTLENVGGQFTPDRGETLRNTSEAIGNVAQAVTSLLPVRVDRQVAAAAAPPAGTPACNAGPQVIGVSALRRLPAGR